MSASYSNLAVGFITPAFAVAGAVLVGIPILIHILNRRRFKRIDWAAMEFLLRAMRKNRRRIQFEQWILLAVRCLVLAFLGLALARPLSCQDSSIASLAAQRSGLHVFVIDNSYSMAYEADRPDARTHLDQAKRMAKAMIGRLAAGGESVAIVTAAAPATAVIAQPSYDLDGARAAIDRIEQTFGDTDLAGALQTAIEIGRADSKEATKSLYLFTDATRGAWQAGESQAIRQAGTELPAIFRVTHFNLGRADQWNQATLDVKSSNKLVTTKFNQDFLAVVKGFGRGPDALLQWKMDDSPLSGGGNVKLDAETPPQTQSQTVMRTGGPHVITANLVAEDRLKLDNSRSRVVNVVSELKVLIVEGERGLTTLGGSGAFLQLALAPPREATESNGAKSDSYVSPELVSDLELGNKVLSDYRCVILAGVGQLQTTQADQLQKFVQAGGTLMMFMGEQVNGPAYNTVLLPRKLLPGPLTKRMTVGSDQKGFAFDFKANGVLHPLLNVFRGEEKSGLDTAQVFTYWQVELPPNNVVERVLDYVPSGQKNDKDPAITVHSLGNGRVVFVSTTANAEWTSLPAKPAYLTLVHELLSGSVDAGDAWLNLTVGQPLEIPPTVKLTGAPQLSDPTQSAVVMEQVTTNDGGSFYRSRPLLKPGIYTLSTGERKIPVAVNVPSDEADVRTIDNTAIKKALGDIDVALEGDQLPPEAVSKDRGKDFGWSFMLVVFALVGLECFMAMRFGHYRRT